MVVDGSSGPRARDSAQSASHFRDAGTPSRRRRSTTSPPMPEAGVCGRAAYKKAEDGVAVDAEADHAAAAVDLGDRIGRNEAPAAREKARADRDRVRHIRGAAVHGRLHGADDLALRVRDEEADRAEQLWSRDAHGLEATHWRVTENHAPRKGFVKAESRAVDAVRAPPATADRDDRGRQLDARPRGGARRWSRARSPTRSGGRLLRLPLRRARGRADPAGDARHAGRGDDAHAADEARRGHHRHRRGGARAGHDPGAGAPRRALQERSRTCPRTSTSRSSRCRSSPARSSPGRSTCARASRASSRTARSTCCVAIAAQVAQTIEHAKLYAEAQRARVRARGAGADLGGGLGVALPRGVARGDRADDDGRARRDRRRARARGRRDRLARGRAGSARDAHAAALEAAAQIGELVCDRDTPFTEHDRALLASIAHHAAVALEHGARRACAACSPRRSTTGSRTTCRPSPRCCGCRRAPDDDRSAQGARATPSTGSSRSRPCTRC